MGTIKKITKGKQPVVTIDKSLDKYSYVVLFPAKLAMANEMLKVIGLPKVKGKQHHG
jgi:hypothetical protein